jgi:peptide chain release factor 1
MRLSFALSVLLFLAGSNFNVNFNVDAFAVNRAPVFSSRPISRTTTTSTALFAIDEGMISRLDNIRRSYLALTERLGDPDVLDDSKLLQKVMSDRAQSEEVVLVYEEYCGLQEELTGAIELFQDAGDDNELKEMARSEIKEIEPQMDTLGEKMKILLLPKDPNDERNIMLEIRAGTGGSEANRFAGTYSMLLLDWTGRRLCYSLCETMYASTCLFLSLLHVVIVTTIIIIITEGDLLDVYRKYITNMGWKATIIDESSGDDGGYKNVVLEVKGDKVYSKMKWEAGVHRVQRVPATESQGRVHTSTATVAIMPECDEVDVKIDPKDIDMSTMRAGGAGGQVRYVLC